MKPIELWLLLATLIFLCGCNGQSFSLPTTTPEITGSAEDNKTSVQVNPLSIVPDLHECEGFGWESKPTWSPTGENIAYVSNADGDHDIYLLNVSEIMETGEPGNLVNLTNNDTFDGEFSWSPDGKNIAFTSKRDGDLDIYIMNLEDGVTRQLTNDNLHEIRPKWSPGGERIVYSQARVPYTAPTVGYKRIRNLKIYSISVFDGELSTLLTTNSASNIVEGWSPDGKSILSSSTYPSGKYNIYRQNIDDSERVALSNFESGCAMMPLWSPDGKFIVYLLNQYGNSQLYYVDAEGNNAIEIDIPVFSHDPWWSPDSQKFVFSASPDGIENFELFIMNLAENDIIQITDTKDSRNEAPTWSPNGEFITFVSYKSYSEGNIEIIRPDGTGRSILAPLP